MKERTKKLIPWVGGKAQLMWAIQMLLPTRYQTLVDVFGGSGIITLNYEDASGSPQTISKDFSVSAEEMNMDDFNYDPSMDDIQPEQTGMPVWAWVLIGVCGAVVVIVVIVVVVRKRKKAKALAALEAEDSDEDL